MRISKTAAQDLAEAALVDRYQEHEKRVEDLKKYFESVVIALTPPDILEVFKTGNKDYLETSNGYFQIFTLERETKDHRSFYTFNAVPHKSHTRQFKVTGEIFDKLIAWDQANDKFKADLIKDRKSLETALSQLGTYKRIRTTLPEMIPYLPESETTAIVPDMADIRQILGQK